MWRERFKEIQLMYRVCLVREFTSALVHSSLWMLYGCSSCYTDINHTSEFSIERVLMYSNSLMFCKSSP